MNTPLTALFMGLWISTTGIIHKSREWTLESRHFVYKLLLQSIPECSSELIFVASEGPEGCAHYLQSFGIAVMPTRDFLSFNKSKARHPHRRARCIAILPNHSHATNDRMKDFHRIVEKVNVDFGNWVQKPTLVFIYPELLMRQNTTEQKKIMVTIFSLTSNFLLNSDVYTIFVSDGGEMDAKTSGLLQIHEATIWETYSIKGKHFYERIPLSPTLLEGMEPRRKYYDNNDVLNNKVGRRRDFKGLELVASAKNDTPGWARVERVGKKLMLVGGTASPWYRDLVTMLNFTMEIIFGGNIITLKNSSLAGKTLQQLNSGESDFTLMTALVVDFRAKHLTFLQPIYSTFIYVFFRQPSANSIRNIVTVPFHPLLWATIILTWLLLILIVKLGQLFRTRHLHDQEDLPHPMVVSDTRKDANFAGNIGLWAIAATCQKSWYFTPGSIPLKMAFLCGSLCGLLVYGGYSAAVVSTLASHSIPVERFVDLITRKFTFTVHNRSEPFQIILKDLIRLWGLNQEVMKVSTEQEISHLLDPMHPKAFISYQDLFYQAALSLGYGDRFVCDAISKVPLSEFRYKTGMFLKKGSEYAEFFNHKIMILRERGFNFRYVANYDRGNIFNCKTDREKSRGEVEPLDFNDIFTPFLVVFIGYLVSLLILAQERIWTRFMSRRRSSNLSESEKRYSLT